jgi:putative redox protein
VSGRRERVRFPGGSGHELAGVLELPQGEPHAWAVFAPCFTCPKDAKAIVRISQGLAAGGLAVLRYDVTGTGESDGDFVTTTFASQVDDLRAAGAFVHHRHPGSGLVAGISLGGAVVAIGASDIADAMAAATINAPADTRHLRDLLLRLAPQILDDGEAALTLIGVTTRIGRALVEDLPRHRVEHAASELDLPLMVLHAPDDAIVPVAHGERLFAAARQPKSFVAIAGADHLLLEPPGAADRVAAALGLWLRQFVGPGPL